MGATEEAGTWLGLKVRTGHWDSSSPYTDRSRTETKRRFALDTPGDHPPLLPLRNGSVRLEA